MLVVHKVEEVKKVEEFNKIEEVNKVVSEISSSRKKKRKKLSEAEINNLFDCNTENQSGDVIKFNISELIIIIT